MMRKKKCEVLDRFGNVREVPDDYVLASGERLRIDMSAMDGMTDMNRTALAVLDEDRKRRENQMTDRFAITDAQRAAADISQVEYWRRIEDAWRLHPGGLVVDAPPTAGAGGIDAVMASRQEYLDRLENAWKRVLP
jgi:hypothetical protein